MLTGGCLDGGGTQSQVAPTTKQQGVNLVAGHRVTDAALVEELAAHNITWIIQTPFGYQQRYDDPVVRLVEGVWGETDAGLKITAALARERGIKTMLKPHLWLYERPEGKWRSDIDFPDEAGWQQWFEHYLEFLLHYARLAQEGNFEILCIGTELSNPAMTREADWRNLIAAVREVYSGQLTYAANWHREYEEILFWDDLDFIGIQGYFPLSDEPNPSVSQLVAGWQEHAMQIEAISKKFDLPVLFTEQGYKSTRDTAKEPWRWPETEGRANVDQQAQANCYEAFFQTFWHQPWVAGVYWWKWEADPIPFEGSRDHLFTPQGKPAASIMRRWFGDE